MSDKGLTGRCLCGEVEVHATQAEEQVGVCHCDMCRKWSGGPFYSAHCGVAVTPLKGKMPLPASRRLRGLTEAFVTAAVPIYFISTKKAVSISCLPVCSMVITFPWELKYLSMKKGLTTNCIPPAGK